MAKTEVDETPAVEYADNVAISEEHRQYLLQRHGTVDLDPLPDMNDDDPYNWPKSKKVINIILVAFHAMMGTFTAAAIQSAFENIAVDLHISIQRTSYLTSLVIAILGGAPLFWRPLSQRFGRRPIFLLSLIGSLIGNLCCAASHSFAVMGWWRAWTALFISPASAIGSGVVMETFFKHESPRYIGVWTIMVTIGVPVAPFIFGFVAERVGYRWIYYTLAMTNGVQFVLYFFLGPETRYVRGEPKTETEASSSRGVIKRYLGFRRIDPTPLAITDFIAPLALVMRPCVVIAAAAHAMVFLWGSIMITIEMPQLFPAKFGFNTEQVGLQFLSVIIGSVLGEQIGSMLCAWWMGRRVAPAPEFRLWISYIGTLLTICGTVVFLVQIDRATSWNITPDIGAAIAAAGNQIVTTVMMTYAVNCHLEDASSVGVFVTFVRQTWGFIGPFWFPQLLENVGLPPSAGVATALMVGVSILPVMLAQWKGSSWR